MPTMITRKVVAVAFFLGVIVVLFFVVWILAFVTENPAEREQARLERRLRELRQEMGEPSTEMREATTDAVRSIWYDDGSPESRRRVEESLRNYERVRKQEANR